MIHLIRPSMIAGYNIESVVNHGATACTRSAGSRLNKILLSGPITLENRKFRSANFAANTERASQLRIPIVRQGAVDKLETYRDIIASEGVTDDQVAYMGDDVLDLPVLARVGLSAAPADAMADVLPRVIWISAQRGGHGAVREMIELVLRAQGRWDELLSQWTMAPSRV